MDTLSIHYGYVLPCFLLFSTKTIRQALQKNRVLFTTIESMGMFRRMTRIFQNIFFKKIHLIMKVPIIQH